MSTGSLALADWRRRVADLYAAVRRRGVGPEAWTAWRDGRDALFATHPQSPVPQPDRAAFRGMPFFPYDPSWCLVGHVVPMRGAGESTEAPDGMFRPIAEVVAERHGVELHLTLMWLEGYGGGLFLPFRDATNGAATYGGGRYLLDQVKGADLGVAPGGDLVLDFNFAYHPSCAHDPRWTCPLAPVGNTVAVAIQAGELAPGGVT